MDWSPTKSFTVICWVARTPVAPTGEKLTLKLQVAAGAMEPVQVPGFTVYSGLLLLKPLMVSAIL